MLSFCLEDETLAGLAEGTLDAAEQARAKRHLDGCAACFACLIEQTRLLRVASKLALRVPAPRVSKPSRSPLLIVPFAGLAAMIAIAGWVRASSLPELCNDPRAQIERMWSADERAAFAGDDAGAVWVGQLDRYADGWARATEQSCAAARRDDASPPELHAQLQCLADQRARFDAFTTTAAIYDGDPAQLFDGALALPPIGVCPPGDDELAVTEIRAELARHEGIALAGGHDGALAGIGGLEQRARALGLRGVEAELLLARGRIHAAAGELELAAANLLAASNAAEAGRADLSLVASLTALVEVTSTRGELVRAREYADRTAAAIERIGVPDHRRDGALALARARIELVAERWIEAEIGMHAALTVLPTDDPAWAVALDGLATAQAARGDHPAAQATLHRVLDARITTLGEYHPRVAETRLELARAHHAIGDRDAALLELDVASPIAARAAGPRSTTLARILDLRGELLRELGHDQDAIEHFRRARRMLVEQLGEHHELVVATERHEALALAQAGVAADAPI